MTGKILVIRGGAIGDFILTLPALQAIRRKFPHSRLEILGYPKIACLALDSEIIDSVRSLEDPSLAPFFTCDAELLTDWRDYFSSFDLIVSYTFDPEGIFRSNIQRCTQAQFLAAAPRPLETESVHATKFFLSPLQQIGIVEADSFPRLKFLNDCFPPDEVWIAAHPGSGSSKKNWAEENWLELLRAIRDQTNWHCLLIGGEAEGDRLQRFQKKLSSNRFCLAQDLPLTELAKKLQPCNAFVGHDSGITHLAAALGLPVLVLWGQTNQIIWGPRSEKVIFFDGGEKLAEIRPITVFSQLQRLLVS